MTTATRAITENPLVPLALHLAATRYRRALATMLDYDDVESYALRDERNAVIADYGKAARAWQSIARVFIEGCHDCRTNGSMTDLCKRHWSMILTPQNLSENPSSTPLTPTVGVVD